MRKEDIQNVYPLSPLQEGMLFHALLHPKADAYFQQVRIDLAGDVDEEAFREAWAFLVRRHDVLRTVFVHRNAPQPLQVVLREQALDFATEDIRSLPESEHEAWLTNYQAEERRKPFDLSRDRLLRVRLVRRGATRWSVVLSFHHILLDGWCQSVLFSELAAAYRARRLGQDPVLPAALPYGQYIRWLQQQDREAALAHWRTYLDGYETAPTVPWRRSAVDGYELRRHEVMFDVRHSDALRALAARLNVTVNTLLQCAWGCLLGRYNGTQDVVFGSVVAGRPQELPGIERALGLFINTVPVRLAWQNGTPFEELAGRLQADFARSEPYQFLSLADIRGALPGAPELINHIFVFENYPVERADAANGPFADLGFTVERMAVFEQTNYDFNLTVLPGDTVLLRFEYNARAFDPGDVARMEGHWRRFLDAVLADPRVTPEQIDILTPAERRVIVGEWGQAPARFPADVTAARLFVEQALAEPDRLAVVAGGERRSYGELLAAATRVAAALQAAGVGPEVPVGVCVDRSWEMIAAVLGVMLSGGAYVPLDPSYPPDRLAFMVSDLGARHLLASPCYRGLVTGAGGATPCVLSVDEALAGTGTTPDPRALAAAIRPEQLAYVIYTSGSTGRPKGAMIEHRSLANAYLAWDQAYALRASIRVHLQMASLSFDVFSGDLVRALCSGGALVLCPREWLLDAERLYALLREEHVECAEFVPAVLRNLAAYVRDAGLRLDSLRVLIAGSDTWTPDEYRAFRALCGPATRLINSYGLTEATIDSTYYEAPAEAVPDTRAVPIGRPFANTTLYILDRSGRPVPAGIPGELFIGGAGLARGYWNRPELTAERFVASPLPGEADQRLYRTGDQAQWLRDGNVEFIGRGDSQIKIRGYRVEAAEVEAALRGCPGVRQAVVVGRETPDGSRELVGYVVSDNDLREEDVRRRLKDQVPDYMVPSRIVRLEAFPLTPNGKVNRRALPDPAAGHGLAAAHVAAEPPAHPLEQALADIWRGLLGRQDVGMTDNFFELGGHSLKATQLIARISKDLKRDVPLTAVFRFPTIRTLAEFLLSTNAGRGAGSSRGFYRLNAEAPHQVFALPAGAGLGLGYAALARQLNGVALHGINASLAADPIGDYVAALQAAQSKGPYVLLGYCGGGNLAFEVARRVEAAGQPVAALLMIDSYRRLTLPTAGQEAIRARAQGVLCDPRFQPYLLNEALRAQFAAAAEAWFRHEAQGVDDGQVSADIHLVTAEGPAGDPSDSLGRRRSRDAWREATRGVFECHAGVGAHDTMLEGEALAANAALVQKILRQVLGA